MNFRMHQSTRALGGRVLFWAVAALVALAPGEAASAKGEPDSDLTSAVLRVESVIAPPDWSAPWKVPAPFIEGGTAFAIAGERLVTNAHVVNYAQQITVKKNDGSAPVLATVEALDESCDLAVLKVASKSFFTNIHPLAFGPLPATGSSVTIYGYPLGGHELSTTTGVVSRIEMQYYSEGGTSHLAGQTDAAINPGNSGGPVVQGKAVVGVAFQNFRAAQNIGYFIPTPIVRHFLDDLSDGSYEGFPDAPLTLQTLESPALRRELGLPDDRSGVVVEAVAKGSSFQGVLIPGDVLLAVAGESISDDGTFAAGRTRLPLRHLLETRSVGQTVPLQVWREGQVAEVSWKADRYAVMDRLRARTPRYLVYGGLVFTPLSYKLLYASRMPPERRVEMLRAVDSQTWGPGHVDDREIIVLTRLLPDPVNDGISDATPVIVDRLNGRPVPNLAALARMLDESHVAHDVFSINPPHEDLAVVDHAAATAGASALLHAHGIAHDRNL
jgi:S1-C subfamily serine protease